LATRWAEIDLLARDGDWLVAVEVKSGSRTNAARYDPALHLGPRQERALRRALLGLAEEVAGIRGLRLDLAVVLLGGAGKRVLRIQTRWRVDWPGLAPRAAWKRAPRGG
jgi:Holliday junction resolvase-like predicted endonuclease